MIEGDKGTMVNKPPTQRSRANPPPPFLVELLRAGGLIPRAGRLAGEP